MGLGLRSLSKRERSWVLYDVGNSAYVMLAATLIPIYFSAIAEPGSSAVVAWGYATTVASLALALLMPLILDMPLIPPMELPEEALLIMLLMAEAEEGSI